MCLSIMGTKCSFTDCGLILHCKNSLQLAYSIYILYANIQMI